MFYAALLLVVITPNDVKGFSSGAPPVACNNDLLPLHSGFSSTDDPLPFFVNLTDFIGQTYIPNQLYHSKQLELDSYILQIIAYNIIDVYYTYIIVV